MNDRMFGRPSSRLFAFPTAERKLVTPTVKYSGDRSAVYDQATGAGLVGKVIGPNARRQWFVVTEANYDAETDTTYVTAELLRRPEGLLP